MTTRILSAEGGLDEAVSALRAGETVALPTETVYGLAASALNPTACARIFEAKGRPLSDPLIVHLPDSSHLGRVADVDPLSFALAKAFWPGPLTLILPRRAAIPDIVTAGQDTVAVRESAHPVFRAVAAAFGGPLAAPSANRFGRISPTTAPDVVAELGGAVGLVLDGGPCAHGIESTIARSIGGEIEILREGPVTAEMLAAVGSVRARPAGPDSPTVPGGMKSHYAPATRLEIRAEPLPTPGVREGLIAWCDAVRAEGFAAVEVLSPSGDLTEAAANLYGAMRRLDAMALDRIVAAPVPTEGIGAAVAERLMKASA